MKVLEEDIYKVNEMYEFNKNDAINRLNDAVEYILGEKDKRNFERFLSMCTMSALQGNEQAQYILGIFYEIGIEGLEVFFETEIETDEKWFKMIDYKKALKWYEKSAKLGDKSAQYRIAYMYYRGVGIEIDYKKAFYWFELCKSDNACFYIAYMYQQGLGFEVNYKKAMEWYLKSAELGNVNSKLNIGVMYENGLGVDVDYKVAKDWYEKAAECGSSEAYSYIGMLYRNGQGVEVNYEKAMEYHLKAADLGNITSICQVGYMYHVGLGVEVDFEKAFEWYKRAGDFGYADAQCNLGYMYENGEGVEKDYEKALEYYLEAANQGDSIAKSNVGAMYKDGLGCEVNYNKAMEYFDEALEIAIVTNDLDSKSTTLFNIAEMYEEGLGVELNYRKAIKLYKEAASYQLDEALEKLEKLKDKCDDYKEESEMVHKIADKIYKTTLKDVIHIKTKKGKTSLYNSKFGGVPYLNREESIPTNEEGKELKLLAQINFEELPSNDEFPKSGIIQFYVYPDDLYGADFDNPQIQKDFRVVYHENIDLSITEEEVKEKIKSYKIDGEDTYFPIEGEFKLEFEYGKEGLSLSDYRFEKMFIKEFNEAFPQDKISKLYDLEEEVYNKLFEELTSAGHKLGGYPFFTQEDPRGYKELEEFNTLLLQIDSEYGENMEIMWGDSGVCNFFIKDEDLKNKDFSKIVYNWDCY